MTPHRQRLGHRPLVLSETLDQRGSPRVAGVSCEAGAYDGESVPAELMEFSIE